MAVEPNKIILDEHMEIRKLLSALDGMAAFSLEKGVFPVEDAKRALDIIVEHVDRCHHGKEEKVLFPVLSGLSPEIGREIARRLTSDHRGFRRLVANMLGLVMNLQKDPKAKSLMTKDLSTYTRLVRAHMGVEEDVLFKEVERSIIPSDRAKISEAFAKFDRDLGNDPRRRCFEEISRLVNIYGY